MRPGENCLSCHSFSVAGTVYPGATAAASTGLSGVTVHVVDAKGTQVTMTTNAAGNFYTSQALAKPLRSAWVIRDGVLTTMSGAPDGACSSCHGLPPAGGAAGRLFAN